MNSICFSFNYSIDCLTQSNNSKKICAVFKHNIIELFRSFSREEIIQFEKFLNNNSSMKMLKLYHEIIKFYPDFSSDSFSKNTLSVNTSLSGTFNESTLRDALSELMKVTLKYLSISNFENNDHESANLIMEDLLQRNSSRILQKKIRDGKEFFDSDYFFDSRYQYNKYWFESLVYNYESASGKIMHKTKALEKLDKLSRLSFTLLSFYIPEIVSLYLNARIMSEKYNLNFTESPLSKLGDSLDINNLIRIYEHENPKVFMLYKMLLDIYNNFDKEQYYF